MGEPRRRAFNEEIAGEGACFVSAGFYLDTAIVIEARYGYEGIRDLALFQEAAVAVVPFDVPQAGPARRARAAYDKGRHIAGLDIGDCFAYALARKRGGALLFKGRDAALTDLGAA